MTPTSKEQKLEWRCVDQGDECNACGGSGVKLYGSTSTWRGGFGGQELTHDQCDKCWGSGSASKPWPPPVFPGYRVYRDGDQWCAVGRDFRNLQESHAGFGLTPESALIALLKDETNGTTSVARRRQ